MPSPARPHIVAIRLLIGGLLAAALAAAACGASGTTLTTPSTSAKCAVTTTANGSPLSSTGGTASVGVTTERECPWTASSDASWLKITGGSSGQGPGTVDLAAAANADPATRSGTVLVNDQRVTLTQAAAECHLELSDTAAAVPPSGAHGSVGVQASSAGCPWTATSDASWVAITSGASGTGSGTVAFAVSPSTGGSRSATLTIGGLPFTVEQSDGCSYAITPSAYSAASAGGTTSVMVTAGHDCPWEAISAASWITVAPASGTGDAAVSVTVAAATGATRSGTATIAGHSFTVTQSSGCHVTLAPESATVAAAGATGRIDVSAGPGCGWTAASDANWLSVIAGDTGSGNGAVGYVVAANAGAARLGIVTVGGQTFTVDQAAACTASIAPDAMAVAADASSRSVQITTPAGCAWTAASSADWITVSAASGSGPAAVDLTMARNTGAARTGTATIATRIVTVTQDSACTFAISPTHDDFDPGGGNGSVSVRAAAGCPWTARSNVPWVTITSAAEGSGNGSVKYTVDKNPKGSPARTGTMTIAGESFTVTQKKG